MHTRPRARHVARAGLALAALVLGVSLHTLAGAWISGRTVPPIARQQAARAAAAAAGKGAAPRWAPRELGEAASALAEAEAQLGQQAARPWPWRSFDRAADLFWSAEARARRAGERGEERRVAARAEAADVIEEAARLLRTGEDLVAATALPAAERVHLARARFLISEARSLAAAEEYALAGVRADAGRLELGRALGPSLAHARRYASAEQVETWRRWIEETRAWSRASGRPAVVVVKERNELRLIERGLPVSFYSADIGSNALGRKLRAGDRATPEGRYRVTAKKSGAETRFHKALMLDYPNEADRRRIREARRAGSVPGEAQPGGLIEIHGEGGRGRNWTDGCVALSNGDMDDIFRRVQVGSWVTIVGGDGSRGAFSDIVGRLSAERGAP